MSKVVRDGISIMEPDWKGLTRISVPVLNLLTFDQTLLNQTFLSLMDFGIDLQKELLIPFVLSQIHILLGLSVK